MVINMNTWAVLMLGKDREELTVARDHWDCYYLCFIGVSSYIVNYSDTLVLGRIDKCVIKRNERQ